MLVAAAFLTVAIAGFTPGLTTRLDQLQWFGPDSRAQLFGVFGISMVHNLLHLVFGVAGLLLGLSYMGGEGAQIALGVSSQTTRVFQGILLFFVLVCDTFIIYRPRLAHAPARAAQTAAR